MRAANRNFGFLQTFRAGTFTLPAAGTANFVFDSLTPEAPGGGAYEIVNVILRFPTGAVQFPVGAGQYVSSRTIFACFNWSLVFGSDCPVALAGGVGEPNQPWISAPGVLVADALAMHSRSPLVDIDGVGIRGEHITGLPAATIKPTLSTHSFRERHGWAGEQGPYAVGVQAAFGATEQIDIILPLGRRQNLWVSEDVDDTAIPSQWFSGKVQGTNGLACQPAKLTLTLQATTEGGNAVTFANNSVVEVWLDVVVRRDNRASCPMIPILRWEAPPQNSTDVKFLGGAHFWSGFGNSSGTTSLGNVNATFDQLTQTFTSFQLRNGSNIANYQLPADYLKNLRMLAGLNGINTRPPWTFGNTDDPLPLFSMALLRERGGIFPVAVPDVPLLVGTGSDSENTILATYQGATPASPFQLQNVYPLYTKPMMELALRMCGMSGMDVFNAVDSVNPELALDPFLPKIIRPKVVAR